MKENMRLARERDTISKMIALYCRKNHHGETAQLCADCQTLEKYALERIMHCPYGADKPTCAKCTIHCYRSEKREKIRQVMRFSGPRMLLYHPLLTILHLMDGFRNRPD